MEFETCIITSINNNEKPDSGTLLNNQKRKRSIVWEYFTVETVGAGCAKAYCKQCKKSFSYMTDSIVAGTSNLK